MVINELEIFIQQYYIIEMWKINYFIFDPVLVTKNCDLIKQK